MPKRKPSKSKETNHADQENEDQNEGEALESGQDHEEDDREEEGAGKIAGKGHNRKKPRQGGLSQEQLKSIVERIERLEEEKAGIASDIKDIFAEAKGNGYDTKTIRKCIALRKKSPSERDEEEYLLDTYKRALGMAPELEHEHGAED